MSVNSSQITESESFFEREARMNRWKFLSIKERAWSVGGSDGGVGVVKAKEKRTSLWVLLLKVISLEAEVCKANLRGDYRQIRARLASFSDDIVMTGRIHSLHERIHSPFTAVYPPSDFDLLQLTFHSQATASIGTAHSNIHEMTA